MTTLYSCQTKSTQPNIEKAISDLTDKYPQLPKGKTNQTDYYKLVRSVTNGESNFQLQLRSTPDSIEDKQQIIILINQKNECYAIPFFSNKYFDYWNFEFDKPNKEVKKTNTTFEKEFTKAINTLNLNDTLETSSKVINELFKSLLNCEQIKETDSIHFEGLSLTNCYDLPNENFDSCWTRQRKNFNSIKRLIHPSKSYYNYNAYLDNQNSRIYQIVNQEKDRWKKMKPSIKMYRQGCNFRGGNDLPNFKTKNKHIKNETPNT
ncbi:MAG: hypothetical protein WCG93_15290 [Paludibacter sp.]